jgi:prepilin-type N-terminal cleavage/methylation domain-containing protein
MRRNSSHGFSLVELMISMSIMLVIAGAATTALMKMTNAQATIWNRTQMHSGIRGATEVLQQEVGQAGRITIPNDVKLHGPVTAGANSFVLDCVATCVTGTTATSGLFVNELLVVDGTTTQETVKITLLDTTTQTVTATFVNPHAAQAPVRVLGAFATGVVPPLASPSSYANGSTGSTLKMFGDINADGKMVYIEYTCEPAVHPTTLYRNSMDWDQTSASAAASASQILLSNIRDNPDGSPCFTYQTQSLLVNGVTTYFVTDVAITLTVQTQLLDPVTKQPQLETKALLNVSPRNVFNAWTLASLGITNRIQPMPATVTSLLQ